jgi:E3 ubiquitin-protein ligase ATL41
VPSGDARNNTAASGCLPADQSCYALSAGSSREADAAARACCTATSYLVVLGISFASLLVILLVLCAIRWYLVRRSEAAESAAAAAPPGTETDKKRSVGLDADAIAALPEFGYRKGEDNEEEEERECAVCLAAMVEGEAARRLPRCAHVFHRGCVDVWLRERSTCPVCRAEVVVCRPPGEGCARKETTTEGGGASRASTSTSRRPPGESEADDGERDLEAQL